MVIRRYISQGMEENCYFIIDEDSNDAIIIDPGVNGSLLCEIIEKNNFNIKAICLTHCHYDHFAGINEVVEMTNAPVLIADEEVEVANSRDNNLSIMFGNSSIVRYDGVLSDGETAIFGSLMFQTILTPGHTKGSCCFYFEDEKALFTGDTLFYGSVGRTDFPTGDADALINSINNKLLTLKGDVNVYPGHGEPSKIGYEKKYNKFLKKKFNKYLK